MRTPSAAEVFAHVEDLPFGMAAVARHLLTAPGTTSDHLLIWAEALDAGSQAEAAEVRHPRAADDAWHRFADVLRFAAPRHAGTVPRVPLTAEEADASSRRRAAAAGLATAGGVPGR